MLGTGLTDEAQTGVTGKGKRGSGQNIRRPEEEHDLREPHGDRLSSRVCRRTGRGFLVLHGRSERKVLPSQRAEDGGDFHARQRQPGVERPPMVVVIVRVFTSRRVVPCRNAGCNDNQGPRPVSSGKTTRRRFL